MKKIIATLISNSGTITIVAQGKTYMVGTDHMRYPMIIKAIKNGDTESIISMIDVSVNLKSAFKKTFNKEVELTNGVVTFKGEPLHNACTKRIVELWKGDLPFLPLVKFLERLLKNPEQRAIDELYNFLDCNNLPITEDGYFLAYKRVDIDWLDFHTHTIDNHVGKIVTMNRSDVTADKHTLCSAGLHFCSKEYLKEYNRGKGRMIAVKIDPADVVSIPTDYNNTKGRCCRYEVLMEIENDVDKPDVPETLNKPLYKSNGFEAETETEIRESQVEVPVTVETKNYHNLRGIGGRWVKKGTQKNVYSYKPNGQKYHNLRGNDGKFAKKS